MSNQTEILNVTKNTDKAAKFFKRKLGFTLGPSELKDIMNNSNITIIDVRKSEHYQQGHIPNAISIPKNELESNLNKLSKDNINIVYCYNQQCHLATRAALILAESGYPVMELEGGIKAWTDDFDYELVS